MMFKFVTKVLTSGFCILMLTNCGTKESTDLSITQSTFGEHQGKSVSLFTLKNNHNMTVKITDYGATVTNIIIPDKNGKLGSITAGFDQFDSYFSEEYINNSPYFGGTIGRYASVMKNATFTLNNKTYHLDKNMGNHHLHGGAVGFDRQMWEAQTSQTQDYVALKLSLTSPDGDQGYPGTVKVSVEYQLNNDNELSIHYTANTDQATPFSLTNHTYFNLNGFSSDILDHQLQLNSQHYLKPDASGLADGTLAPVKGTAADFIQAKRIGDAFNELPMGFEHFYVFDNPQKTLQSIALITEQSSGRTLEVLTTEPSTLLYTGRYTSDNLQREDGTQYGQFKAFCIETSKYQNGPNIPNSPRSILKPNESYQETTVFKLSW
ncbi:aldose epimerase family protein [Paraglaciecola aquimarina]|uniref:Aldose 1-epimerase n=1 Tax=Paraglaciecola aquimarina TaxID=1235557 RepID=A0ABU3SYG1_9ALTE|nr:aldose epimerase family protein [Paraglaciecola aquimarina]MDU0355036.1 aldose epimerase family protein [Paraglaciecola aquimarina]